MLSKGVQQKSEDDSRGAAKRLLESELGQSPGAVIFPRCSIEIPDDTPLFRVAYTDPSFSQLPEAKLLEHLDSLHRLCGQTRREYRNALVFAVAHPAAWQKLQEPDRSPQKTRAAILGADCSLFIPRETNGGWRGTEFDRVELPVAKGSDAGLHDRVLAALGDRLRTELPPDELESILGLGRADCSGIFRRVFPMTDAAEWFFRFLTFPRFLNVEPIRESIRKGLGTGRFGLLRSRELIRLNVGHEEIKDRVTTGPQLGLDEIHFEPGHYLVWRGE